MTNNKRTIYSGNVMVVTIYFLGNCKIFHAANTADGFNVIFTMT